MRMCGAQIDALIRKGALRKLADVVARPVVQAPGEKGFQSNSIGINSRQTACRSELRRQPCRKISCEDNGIRERNYLRERGPNVAQLSDNILQTIVVWLFKINTPVSRGKDL